MTHICVMSSHKPIRIYMGDLILGVITLYRLFCFLKLFPMVGKGLTKQLESAQCYSLSGIDIRRFSAKLSATSHQCSVLYCVYNFIYATSFSRNIWGSEPIFTAMFISWYRLSTGVPVHCQPPTTTSAATGSQQAPPVRNDTQEEPWGL